MDGYLQGREGAEGVEVLVRWGSGIGNWGGLGLMTACGVFLPGK